MRPGALPLALAACLALAALSGCAGATDDPSATTSGTGTSSTTSSTGATTSSTSSSTSAGAANNPPAGTIEVAVEGGSLNATLTLRASDEDSDALSWSVDFGDGTAPATRAAPAEFPAVVTHTFAAVGTYTVTYEVSDGVDATTILSNVTVGSSKAVKTFSGHVVGPDANENTEGECLFALLHGIGAPGGVAGDSFAFGGEVYDDWAFAFDVPGMVAQFQDDAGYVGDKAASGSVPPGATGVLTCSHEAVDTDYVLTLTEP